MNKEYPTPDTRLRIRRFVETTGERSFSFRDVGVQPLTLKRLEDAGLLECLDVESNTTVHHLPEGATAAAPKPPPYAFLVRGFLYRTGTARPPSKTK